MKGLIFVIGERSFWFDWGMGTLKGTLKGTHIFEDKDLTLVGHDLKELLKALAYSPLSEGGSKGGRKINSQATSYKLFDVMLASYLLNPGSRAHDVSSVVLKVLGKELLGSGGQNSLFGVDPKTEAQNLWFILQTKKKLEKELEEQENLGLLEKIEIPLIPVLAQMELNGVALDTKMLADLSKENQGTIKKITKKIYDLAGEEFNIASPLQLREILFEKLKIPTEGLKKGKTGLSTAAAELDKMVGLHPIIELISEFRELAKLQNTYIEVLPKLIDRNTGRVHTHYNQAITATGRLSSSDPNLQNIPVRTENGRKVKEAFVAEPGNVLVVADYSQIELRIVASLAKDKEMIKIFEQGEDIHCATAAAINGVSLKDVSKEMRRAAKEVNFGVLYGMGSYGLSWRTKIPVWQAKEFIDKYFEKFSGVKKYLDRTIKFATESGYCETLFGRRRYFPELQTGSHQLRAAAERAAINHPIQGTAADLMKLAMIEISQQFLANSQQFKDDEVKMILQVHDELVFEVKKGLENKVAKLVKETMESVVKLNVPVEVDISVGKRWGEIH